MGTLVLCKDGGSPLPRGWGQEWEEVRLGVWGRMAVASGILEASYPIHSQGPSLPSCSLPPPCAAPVSLTSALLPGSCQALERRRLRCHRSSFPWFLGVPRLSLRNVWGWRKVLSTGNPEASLRDSYLHTFWSHTSSEHYLVPHRMWAQGTQSPRAEPGQAGLSL